MWLIKNKFKILVIFILIVYLSNLILIVININVLEEEILHIQRQIENIKTRKIEDNIESNSINDNNIRQYKFISHPTETPIIEESKKVLEGEPELISLGTFAITHYCIEKYEHICGEGLGITSTGEKVIAGYTAAANPDIIPYGSIIVINDKEYLVHDTGAALLRNEKIIDLAVDTHENALNFGCYEAEVFIKSVGGK